jgi:hypothetical protein
MSRFRSWSGHIVSRHDSLALHPWVSRHPLGPGLLPAGLSQTAGPRQYEPAMNFRKVPLGGRSAPHAAPPGACAEPRQAASGAVGHVPAGRAGKGPAPARRARPRPAWPRAWGLSASGATSATRGHGPHRCGRSAPARDQSHEPGSSCHAGAPGCPSTPMPHEPAGAKMCSRRCRSRRHPCTLDQTARFKTR